MGNYAAIADLTARLDARVVARLADDGGTVVLTSADATTVLADSTTQAHINACISAAEEEINGAIRGRVDITDTSLWTAMKPYTVSLAIHFLYGRHGVEVPDDVLLNAQEAQRWKRGVAEGKVILQASPQVRSSQVRSFSLATNDDTRVFNNNAMSGFTRSEWQT